MTRPPDIDDTGADDGIDNLLVVLRESAGADKRDGSLAPVPVLEMPAPDGSIVELAPAWFDYLGDMQVRLVFDGADTLRGARMEDLERLQLTPEKAVARALQNLERRYGAPESVPFHDLMQVKGRSLDFDGSYFLDLAFWRALLARHPEGLVAALPRHEVLLWAPAGDAAVIAAMKQNVPRIHGAAEELRISSALYLFKDDRWTVFQRAQPVDETN